MRYSVGCLEIGCGLHHGPQTQVPMQQDSCDEMRSASCSDSGASQTSALVLKAPGLRLFTRHMIVVVNTVVVAVSTGQELTDAYGQKLTDTYGGKQMRPHRHSFLEWR